MKKFHITEYPNFLNYAVYTCAWSFDLSFEKCGYNTVTIDADGYVTISEDEFLIFALRWA